jgi:cation transport ATPase
MTHTYTVSGMTCNGCAASVKSGLLKHPDVLAADIDLEKGQALISMARHVDTTDLQQAIGNNKYKISEDPAGHAHGTTLSETSWFETYKPLLLIFAFITVVAVISSFSNGEFESIKFMNSFMAGFFIVFSFFKLLDLNGFASSYAMYDIVAKKIPRYGFLYPFIELGLGLAYLVGANPMFTNAITFIVMSVSSIGVISSVANKREIQCACLGAVFRLPMTTVTIVEDALMIVMSGWMLLIG